MSETSCDNIFCFIDHTLLKADSVSSRIAELCEQAIANQFCAVCILPRFVSQAADLCKGSSVRVCTVVGFPLGANETSTKVYEAAAALEHGAVEIDMVLPIGALIEGDLGYVAADIEAVCKEVLQKKGALTKVILETAMLTDEQKKIACEIAMLSGADFVKTSTGFGPGGATVHDVTLMREIVGTSFGVKASGGIKSLDQAAAMIKAGANRIGTSSSIEIIRQLKEAMKKE